MTPLPSVPRSDGLPQNSVIAAALLIGFIVYITIKGRLAAYINLIFTAPASATAGGSASNAPSSVQPLPAMSPLTTTRPDGSITNQQGNQVGQTGPNNPSSQFQNYLQKLMPGMFGP